MTADLVRRLQGRLAAADWVEAERLLRRLIAVSAPSASLFYNLGLVLRRQGRNAEAADAFGRAIAADARHTDASFERAAALMDLGRLAEAEAGFSSYLDARPDDADARLNRGRLRLALDRPDAALADARMLPRTAAALLLAAEAQRDRGEFDAMEAALEAALALDPRVAAAALDLRTHGAHGRFRLDASLYAPPRSARNRRR